MDTSKHMKKLQKLMEKLERETGKKVNSSKDDEAGTNIPPRYFDKKKH